MRTFRRLTVAAVAATMLAVTGAGAATAAATAAHRAAPTGHSAWVQLRGGRTTLTTAPGIAAALLFAGTVTAQVRYEDILKGAGQDWLTYSGTYQGSRYSTLKQITRQNASSLVPVWTYHVPEATGLRTSPIVYKGVMYVTNSNAIFALDARTGRLIWRYQDTKAKKRGVNRGAAILGDGTVVLILNLSSVVAKFGRLQMVGATV